MPLIDDFKQKKSNKFVKKEYRPWDDVPSEDEFQKNTETLNIENISPTILKKEENTSLDEAVNVKNPSKPKEKKPVQKLIDKSINKEINSTLYKENIPEPSTNESEPSKRPEDFDLERYARGLYGLQRTLLQIILENISHCNSGFGFTKPLFYNNLSLSIKAPINSVKGSIQRLSKAGIIEVYDFKPGRGGYSCYKINEKFMIFFQNLFKS